jgi:hypothetical protein
MPPGRLAVNHTYDNQGAQTSVAYPLPQGGLPSSFTYTLDAMERPTALTDNNGIVRASGVTYNAANQTTGASYLQWSEARTYNSLLQLTQI